MQRLVESMEYMSQPKRTLVEVWLASWVVLTVNFCLSVSPGFREGYLLPAECRHRSSEQCSR